MTSNERENSQRAPARTDTATIVRDTLILQGKLVIDGLRDAILIPLSLLAALVSLTQTGQQHGKFFYDVVRMGRRTEHWINLFEAADRIYPRDDDTVGETGLDDYLAQVEGRLAREFRNGEVTNSARRAVDAVVEKIRSARSNVRQSGDDDPET